jgi:hypothetical protein
LPSFWSALTHKRLAVPEPVELARLLGELLGVGLVRDQHHRLVDLPQPDRDVLVQRRNPLAHVHHEHDHRGGLERELNLPLHVGAQVVDVDDPDAARVHDFPRPAAVLDHGGHAVAGDAGGGVDDADPPPGEPVEQRRLADVRPADDRNNRKRHNRNSGRTPAARPGVSGTGAAPAALAGRVRQAITTACTRRPRRPWRR